MIILIKLIGVAMAVVGGIYLVKPEIMKKYINFWISSKRMYLGAVISFVVGLIFLIAAGKCQWSSFMIMMGVLSIVKSVAIFVLGIEKMKKICQELIDSDDKKFRIFSLVALGVGILIILAV